LPGAGDDHLRHWRGQGILVLREVFPSDPSPKFSGSVCVHLGW
jgi:hypothetical protein